MTITEHLMRPGTGTLSLHEDTPDEITTPLRAAIDEQAGGPGAHVVITPTPHAPGVDLTGLLTTALWTGRIVASSTRTTFDLVGLGSWLDSFIDSSITTGGYPASLMNYIIGQAQNGLTVGDNKGGGGYVFRNVPAYSATWRDLLDEVAGLGGWEYEIRPDFTVDFGLAANLFSVAGAGNTVVVTARDEGQTNQWRGIEGSMLEQEISGIENIASHAAALGQRVNDVLQVGTATRSISLQRWNGGSPKIVKVCNAASEADAANLNTTAQNFLNLTGPRRKVAVASNTANVRQYVRPGDEVFAWDLPTGLVASNGDVIEFRGQSIAPITLRLLSLTWPINPGFGCYAFTNGTSSVVDLTRWATESSTAARWEVGDWRPDRVGALHRADPLIEQRASGG